MFDDLIQELKKPEYQNLSDVQAADLINAKEITIRKPISVVKIKSYAIKEGFYADIEDACLNSDSSKRRLCKNIMAWIADPAGKIESVDFDDATTQSMLLALKNFGLITSTQINAIDLMANKTLRWVDSVGIGTCGIGFIQNARKAISKEMTNA